MIGDHDGLEEGKFIKRENERKRAYERMMMKLNASGRRIPKKKGSL